MTMDIMIGIDLAKNVFQVHGASLTGQVIIRKRLSRLRFHKFRAALEMRYLLSNEELTTVPVA
jgi:hypothetical protein